MGMSAVAARVYVFTLRDARGARTLTATPHQGALCFAALSECDAQCML